MARRDSQGLQITLIVFVMLTIILAVTTIAFWSHSKSLNEENTSLKASNQESTQAEREATDEMQRMKVWLGQSGDTPIDVIEQQYNRDMTTYAMSVPEVQRTYKDVPAVLFGALQQRNKQAADLRKQQEDAQAEFEQTRKQLMEERDEARKMKAESDADLRKARDEFAQYRDQLNQERDKQVADLQGLRTEMETLQAKTTQQLQEMSRELKNRELIIDQRDGQLAELTTETFDVPDGKVLWVNPRTGIAYINLGAADGLRQQVTFSVYGVDVNNLAREERKGSLEVTRIVNDHLAEAQITDDAIGEPILAGDVVYTPLWNTKSALHFALAGTIDIDGDGQDDREIIKQLIRINNGTIDAEEKDGKIQGKMTRYTRYLIRGEEPSVGDVDDSDATARQNAWSKMIEMADELGVEELGFEKLLDFVGYDGDKRTLPLGTRARTEDFEPRGQGEPGQGSVFRDRRPRPSGQGVR